MQTLATLLAAGHVVTYRSQPLDTGGRSFIVTLDRGDTTAPHATVEQHTDAAGLTDALLDTLHQRLLAAPQPDRDAVPDPRPSVTRT